MSAVSDVLDGIAATVTALAPSLPGPFSVAAQVAAIALGSASEIAKAGKDPVKEIARLHSSHPLVKGAEGRVQALVDAKFGKAADKDQETNHPESDEAYGD